MIGYVKRLREGRSRPYVYSQRLQQKGRRIGRVGAMITYGTYGEIRSFAAAVRGPAGPGLPDKWIEFNAGAFVYAGPLIAPTGFPEGCPPKLVHIISVSERREGGSG